MPPPQTIVIQVDQAASRLDHFLAQEFPQLSRSQIKKLIQQEQVLVGNQPVKPSSSVQPGDTVTLHLPASLPDTLQPESMPLDIVYEDDDLIVVNKAAGVVVHPGHGHRTGTLVNGLLDRYPDLAEMTQVDADSARRPGIVHRLDQDTSGLMVVARTPEALHHLRRQFKSRAVEKGYLALVEGQPQAAEGVIDVPLGRDPRQRQKFAPLKEGKSARTHFRVAQQFARYTLLEIKIETGRTHQIRVHLAWLKCPVVGDTVYGKKKNRLGLNRQFLHAWRLSFQHSRSEEMVQIEAPLSEDLQQVLDRL